MYYCIFMSFQRVLKVCWGKMPNAVIYANLDQG